MQTMLKETIQNSKPIMIDHKCWACGQPLGVEGSSRETPKKMLLDQDHAVIFHDGECLSLWLGRNPDVSVEHSDLNDYLIPYNNTIESGQVHNPHMIRNKAVMAQNNLDSDSLEGAPRKGGSPSFAAQEKKNASYPPTFTMDDVRNMKYWHPLYKELKEVLTDLGHWRNKPRGGSYAKGNPYRFNKKSES